jgi:hypothetical protein
MRPWLWMGLGMLLGVGATLAWPRERMALAAGDAAPAPLPRVRLYRFELNPDALDTFEQWVAFEHAHHPETVATLAREQMYVEALFRDRSREPGVLYWLAVDSGQGASVESSPLPIDKVYQDFMARTLQKGSRRVLETEYVLMPDFLLGAIQAQTP